MSFFRGMQPLPAPSQTAHRTIAAPRLPEPRPAPAEERTDTVLTRNRWSRRRFLTALAVAALALGGAACGGDDDNGGGGGDTSAEAGKKVAFIGVAPVTQGNWDPAGYQAFTRMAEKYGFDPSNQESVGYDQAAAVLRRLAPDNDMVIAHSSGYEAAVHEVAPEFPDTQFVVFSDLSSTKGQDNVAGWAINWNELGYLAGTAGCFAGKEKGSAMVAHVNSEPIPAFTRFAGGEQDGVRASGCQYLTRWTGSFSDVAKAKQAALSMFSDGADALTSTADTGDQGSRDAAVERDKLFVPLYVEAEKKLAPDNTVTVVLVDFNAAYDEMGKLFSEDRLQSKVYPVDVPGGKITYLTPFSNVGNDVERRSVEVFDEMRSGELQVDPNKEIKP
jgi:basic membrane protein A